MKQAKKELLHISNSVMKTLKIQLKNMILLRSTTTFLYSIQVLQIQLTFMLKTIKLLTQPIQHMQMFYSAVVHLMLAVQELHEVNIFILKLLKTKEALKVSHLIHAIVFIKIKVQ